MNVLYYLPDISQANGGIRQYACALLKILALDPQNTYFILHNTQDPVVLSIVESYPNLKLIPSAVGRERSVEKALRYARLLSNQVLVKAKLSRETQVLGYVERLCNRYKIDKHTHRS